MKDITLIDASQFQSLVDTILSYTKGAETLINLSDSAGMTTRFANNQIIQNVVTHTPDLRVEIALGKRVGNASTNQFDQQSLKQLVDRAREMAKLTPEDPEYLPPLEPPPYPAFNHFDASTASQQPDSLAQHTAQIVVRCQSAQCTAAGTVTAIKSAVGIANSRALRGFDQRTYAAFSLTATKPDSTGWSMNKHRRLSALGIEHRTQVAIDKANASANPKEIEPGHYEVILEPAAVSGLIGPMMWSLGAKNFHKGNSPYVGKLNQQILDPKLRIDTHPTHPDLLGAPFNRQGLAYQKATFFANGTPKQLIYDRFTAKEHHTEPTPFPRALIMQVEGDTADSVQALIAQTKRGILVTNFWYIRYVNRSDLTLTGMTRDGTFLIEDGKIVGGIKNFRWHDSPLRVLKKIAAATQPHEATTSGRGKMLLPYLKLPDFRFSSVTTF